MVVEEQVEVGVSSVNSSPQKPCLIWAALVPHYQPRSTPKTSAQWRWWICVGYALAVCVGYYSMLWLR